MNEDQCMDTHKLGSGGVISHKVGVPPLRCPSRIDVLHSGILNKAKCEDRSSIRDAANIPR
jgi:hypothetical protein